MLPGTQPRSHASWVMTSALLLLIYLAFFHLCIGASYQVCIALGVGSWLVWTVVCWYLRGVFWNRFEYFIHQLVGLDLLMEGFIPFHEGYGFYVCAACFWLVFLVNHFLVAVRRRVTSGDAPAIRDSVVSDSKFASHFDESLLPHMKRQAAAVNSPIGQSLEGISLEALRSFCQDHVFARRWIEECCPELGDGKLRIGTDCDPLPIRGIEDAYTDNEQSQAMLDLKLFCFAYAGDGELFVISMDSGRVYRMVHQWRIDEKPFEDWVSEEWSDIPNFLKSITEN